MHLFLTSSNLTPNGKYINEENGFRSLLLSVLPFKAINCLYIASDPEDKEHNDEWSNHQLEALKRSKFKVNQMKILDLRSKENIEQLIQKADLIILGGGHVPTQNHFFHEIHLKKYLKDYEGVIVGISAGSMNCARIVYAMPELPGEYLDKKYNRFLDGLSFTDTMIIPHYNEIHDDQLDGVHIFKDIAYPDSLKRTFIVLVDGSYIHIHEGIEELYGLSYKIEKGKQTLIQDKEKHTLLTNSLKSS